jgi:anti-sigma B factor antagonist
MNIAPFNVEVEPLDRAMAAFSISGELDQATAAELRRPLMEAIESGTLAVMIDMTKCSFVDSTGLGVIVEAWKLLEERNGERASLAICCAEPEVRRLLKVTGLDQAIAIRDSREEAIEVIRA